MRSRLISLLVFGIFLLSAPVQAQSLPAGFARNPYGVAGSPGSLKSLSMPVTSPFYDWTPKEKARYITVRPYCPPRSCDGSKPWEQANYWFWNATSNTIGHNETDRKKFSEFVARNKGATWIIGNEPDSRSQDNLTPIEYVKMYQTYYTQVRKLDPSAKFAITSITGATYHKEFLQMQAYYDAVFSEYMKMHQREIDFDYWNLHAYYAGWTASHAKTPETMLAAVNEQIINPFLTYRLTVNGGEYRLKPILATEIGMSFGNNNSMGVSEQTGIEFMKLYTRRLLALVDDGSLESFFWFYGGYAPGDYFQSCLLNEDWKTPTALGIAYAKEARAWDREYGLERADFNQDKRISILDFSSIVKSFGTTNATYSLDTNPRITRSDIIFFKQLQDLRINPSNMLI